MYAIDLIFFDAGEGHRSAATALQLVLDREMRWQTRLVNLQDVLDPIDVVRKFTGIRLQDWYNLLLRKNWTLGASHLVSLLHAVIRANHAKAVSLLEGFWRERRPDLVVSLVPNLNRALFEGARRAASGAPFVTILTDLADYPPHFWIEPQDQFFVCGSERAVEQARCLGIAERQIRQTSGMILHPRFYETLTLDRAVERRRLGLHPDLRTGLVMFGGQGSRQMIKIAQRLDRSTLNVQLVFICGRNDRLAKALRCNPGRLRHLVVGYTTEIPYYMYLSDFFIGKPGPGSISEALAMKLPVIVARDITTLPQERYNTEWVIEKQVGIVVSGFSQVHYAVEELLCPANFARYREGAARVNNRAIFEIPQLLREILERAEP